MTQELIIPKKQRVLVFQGGGSLGAYEAGVFQALKSQKNRLNVYDYTGIRLETVLEIYRNLRENYEYRLRFDEAGNFFIKEMELKRKYREFFTGPDNFEVKVNGRFTRHLSLIGLYYHISRYGEDLVRPTIAGIFIVLLST